MTLLLDTCHVYTGYWTPGGVCRIRIYSSTPASGGLDVVLCTQVPENKNSSITNMAQYLAAEVLVQHLPQLDGLDPPFVWLEHYPDDCQHPELYHPRGRHQESYAEERMARVTFASTRPHVVRVFAVNRGRVRFGTPDWRHVDRAELEALIGEPWTPECIGDYQQRPRTRLPAAT